MCVCGTLNKWKDEELGRVARLENANASLLEESGTDDAGSLPRVAGRIIWTSLDLLAQIVVALVGSHLARQRSVDDEPIKKILQLLSELGCRPVGRLVMTQNDADVRQTAREAKPAAISAGDRLQEGHQVEVDSAGEGSIRFEGQFPQRARHLTVAHHGNLRLQVGCILDLFDDIRRLGLQEDLHILFRLRFDGLAVAQAVRRAVHRRSENEREVVGRLAFGPDGRRRLAVMEVVVLQPHVARAGEPVAWDGIDELSGRKRHQAEWIVCCLVAIARAVGPQLHAGLESRSAVERAVQLLLRSGQGVVGYPSLGEQKRVAFWRSVKKNQSTR